jgi:hypothetical protein
MHFDRIYVPCHNVTISFKVKRSKHAETDGRTRWVLRIIIERQTEQVGTGSNFMMRTYMRKHGRCADHKRKQQLTRNFNCRTL